MGRFEFKVWYLERSCASSLNFIALVAKLCLPSLSPRQLCESRAARLRSAPLSLFCSPAYLCFFSSSPLSSPARLRGEDDVKLKNGISWWADGGGMVTKLSHVRISVVFSSNPSPPQKRDFKTILIFSSPVRPYWPWLKADLLCQTFILLSSERRDLLIPHLFNVSSKKKKGKKTTSADVVEAPACSTWSVTQHIHSSAPAAERVFLSEGESWMAARETDGKKGGGDAANEAVASHWRCLACFHSTGERYPLLPLSRAC